MTLLVYLFEQNFDNHLMFTGFQSLTPIFLDLGKMHFRLI